MVADRNRTDNLIGSGAFTHEADLVHGPRLGRNTLRSCNRLAILRDDAVLDVQRVVEGAVIVQKPGGAWVHGSMQHVHEWWRATVHLRRRSWLYNI